MFRQVAPGENIHQSVMRWFYLFPPVSSDLILSVNKASSQHKDSAAGGIRKDHHVHPGPGVSEQLTGEINEERGPCMNQRRSESLVSNQRRGAELRISNRAKEKCVGGV